MNKIHLTINTFKDTELNVSEWNIKGEPERISVQFKGKEYCIVLDSAPFFEVWTLDEKGELFNLESTHSPVLSASIGRLVEEFRNEVKRGRALELTKKSLQLVSEEDNNQLKFDKLMEEAKNDTARH